MPENLEHSINSDNDETNEEDRELIIIPLRETYSKNVKAYSTKEGIKIIPIANRNDGKVCELCANS